VAVRIAAIARAAAYPMAAACMMDDRISLTEDKNNRR